MRAIGAPGRSQPAGSLREGSCHRTRERKRRTVAVVRQVMWVTRVKKAKRRTRNRLAKKGSKTATTLSWREQARACRARFSESPTSKRARSGGLPRRDQEPSTSCNSLRVLRRGPSAENLYSIPQQVSSQQSTTFCASPLRAPTHLLRWRSASQKAPPCRNRSDWQNPARVLSDASELAAYPRPFVTGLIPIQKLASKTGELIAHVAKYLDTKNIQRVAEIKLAPKKPVGVCSAPASAAILGVWIHWDPPRLAVNGVARFTWGRARDQNGGRYLRHANHFKGARMEAGGFSSTCL